MGEASPSPAVRQDIWTCGLSLDDFFVPSTSPSTPTTIAQATSAVVAEGLAGSLADMAAISADTEPAILGLVDLEALDWDMPGRDEDEEFASRKVVWPFIDPASYEPASGEAARINDNVQAVRLLKQLRAAPKQLAEQEMAMLLRYAGWGGVARVFAPDGTQRAPYATQRDELKGLVSEEEFAAMQSSINTGFYTPPQVAHALWAMLKQLGFTGGRILEPAAGTGQFLASMPQEVARKSTVTAVELEPVTASILETVYAPYGVQVHACGLQDAKLPMGFFDLVIGNCPFGDYPVADSSRSPYARWSIHNWFMARSCELVRPGGLVVMITSAQTMDSEKDAHRGWLAGHADLVAAFRLPDCAFEKHAKTEAVTDVLIFQRKAVPLFATKPMWISVDKASPTVLGPRQPVTTSGYVQGYTRTFEARVNSYYNHHPEHMVGRLVWGSNQYGNVATPQIDGGFAAMIARLEELAHQLPKGLYVPSADESAQQVSHKRVQNLDNAMPGAFVVKDGRIYISEGEDLLDVDDLYAGTRGQARIRPVLAHKPSGCLDQTFYAIFAAQSRD